MRLSPEQEEIARESRRTSNSEQISIKIDIDHGEAKLSNLPPESYKLINDSVSWYSNELIEAILNRIAQGGTKPFEVIIETFLRIRKKTTASADDFRKFEHFGRIDQLLFYGHELLGHEIEWLEKRDGQNVPLYWSEFDNRVHIGSRNFPDAEEAIQETVRSCKEWPNFERYVREHPYNIVYVENIMAGPGPTKIERPKKNPSMVLIAIYDTRNNTYMRYNLMHQTATHNKLPIVRIVDRTMPATIDDLEEDKLRMLKWCKQHHREGVVGRAYANEGNKWEGSMLLFKEKIDLPKRSKTLERLHVNPSYPAMEHDETMRAINDALNEVIRTGGNPRNNADAMPVVAKWLRTQAEEHYKSVPKNMFAMYLDFCKRHLKEVSMENSPDESNPDDWTTVIVGTEIYYQK